jgi:hypothetical protein
LLRKPFLFLLFRSVDTDKQALPAAILYADVKDYHSCGKVQFMPWKCEVWQLFSLFKKHWNFFILPLVKLTETWKTRQGGNYESYSAGFIVRWNCSLRVGWKHGQRR